MISVEDQQKLLINISKQLKKPLTVYAVGGTAMMFLGFKEATKDIDLVFEDEKDRQTFINALEKIGYQTYDSFKVYGDKKNQPLMYSLGDERFDLFVNEVIDFIFSDEMKKRTEATHQFSDNIFLKIANHHDLIMMKCATDRTRDQDDAQHIINDRLIDWKTLISEAKNQIKLGKETAALELGDFLEKLQDMKVKIPEEVLTELYSTVVKQAEEKVKEHEKHKKDKDNKQ